MIQHRWQSFWNLLGVLVVCNAMITGFGNSASAQIVPDNTLGNESSQVTKNPNIGGLPGQLIEGGAVRGVNLFQSFSQFNIGDGERVYFANPAGIQNILSRVTGNDSSKIFGFLGVNGNANLFLINPNGIIFGQNARLDVAGSFVGTTANAIGFGQNGFFSATNPQTPSPLLTVNPSVFFFNQINQSAAIQNNASTTGLAVDEGKSLLLIGGNITMDAGTLFAPGGRVELGGLAAAGTVEINADGKLNFPSKVARGDVSLTNRAEVNVRAGDSGSIAINAGNLNLAGESKLRAGIETELGTPDAKAGDIEIQTTGTTTITDKSFIANVVQEAARGQAGNVNITADSLILANGGNLNSSTYGQGNAGSIFVQASDVVSLAGNNTVIASNVEAGGVGNGGTINIKAGSLSLWDGAQLQTLLNQAQNNLPGGRGNAGNINIDINGDVTITGVNQRTRRNNNIKPSGVRSEVGSGATGNGGDITIKSGTLSLRNGAQLNTNTSGKGNAGNIFVNTTGSVVLTDGTPSLNTIISSNVGGSYISNRGSFARSDEAEGNAGNITIQAGSLFIKDRGVIETTSFSKGNAGSIFITVNDFISLVGTDFIFLPVELQGGIPLINSQIVSGRGGKGGDINIKARALSMDQAILTAATGGQGDAGSIIINASQRVSIDDSQVFSYTHDGTGKGGDIQINTGSLCVTNGSDITAETSTQGDAGNIKINATDSINISGSNLDGRSSSLSTFTFGDSKGKGGDIVLNTNVLRVSDGAVLDARTRSVSNAGNITINASQVEVLNGGQIISTSSNTGNAGKIAVNASDQVLVSGSDATFQNRVVKFGRFFGDLPNISPISGLYVLSQASGIAGDIEVNSPKLTLDNGGRFIAESALGNGGNINLTVSDLLLMRRDAQISTSAGTAQQGGNGGNINLNSQFLVAIPQGNSDIIANAFTGSGGKVTINTSGIYGFQLLNGTQLRSLNVNSNPRELLTNDISAVSQQGGPQLDGQITINNPDVDPSNGLVPLPADVSDPSNQIAQGCAAFDQANASDFKVSGRGGLPPSPDETLSSDAVWEDIRLRTTTAQQLDSKTTATKPKSESDIVEIVPATSWVFNGKGEVTLVSQTPNATAENLAASSQSCRVR
ncbi:filamentous hemagglutinin N-terminal domain-containing protein [Brasilonema sp. CT11]|nr:filamentous hemagglutinin N-terminal domain-containing protein [Brasilonema sp. CT11]